MRVLPKMGFGPSVELVPKGKPKRRPIQSYLQRSKKETKKEKGSFLEFYGVNPKTGQAHVRLPFQHKASPSFCGRAKLRGSSPSALLAQGLDALEGPGGGVAQRVVPEGAGVQPAAAP